MILIIGGAYQGKTQYAAEHFGKDYVIWNHYHETVRQQLMDEKILWKRQKENFPGKIN